MSRSAETARSQQEAQSAAAKEELERSGQQQAAWVDRALAEGKAAVKRGEAALSQREAALERRADAHVRCVRN